MFKKDFFDYRFEFIIIVWLGQSQKEQMQYQKLKTNVEKMAVLQKYMEQNDALVCSPSRPENSKQFWIKYVANHSKSELSFLLINKYKYRWYFNG